MQTQTPNHHDAKSGGHAKSVLTIEPNAGTSQTYHAEEISSHFFVTCGYTSELLDAVEEALHQIAVFVHMTVILSLLQSVRFGCKNRLLDDPMSKGELLLDPANPLAHESTVQTGAQLRVCFLSSPRLNTYRDFKRLRLMRSSTIFVF
jgi:hypothetical protein